MTFGALPPVGGVLYGVKPVVLAVVAQAVWKLGRTSVKDRFLAVVGVLALALVAVGVHELVVLFGTGAVVAAARLARRWPATPLYVALPVFAAPPAAGSAAVPFGL